MTAKRPHGRPSLGERHTVTARVPIPVRDYLEKLAAQYGTDRSTVFADLAAAAAGRPDLARVLRFTAELVEPLVTEEGLPLAM